MTEPKTCSTCHWWFRFQFKDDEDNERWGRCVYHMGMVSAPNQQVKFSGRLMTRDDFGCIKHEEDKL